MKLIIANPIDEVTRIDVGKVPHRSRLHDVEEVFILRCLVEGEEIAVEDEDVGELEALRFVPGHELKWALSREDFLYRLESLAERWSVEGEGAKAILHVADARFLLAAKDFTFGPLLDGEEEFFLRHIGVAERLEDFDEPLGEVVADDFDVAPGLDELDCHVEEWCIVAADDGGVLGEVGRGPLRKTRYAPGLGPLRPLHVRCPPLRLAHYGDRAAEGD